MSKMSTAIGNRVSDDPIWHTPIKAFSDYMGVAEKVGVQPILENNQYQKVYEARVVAVLCFALYQASGSAWYLQLRKNEITDALIMRQSPTVRGDREVLGVEVTSYFRRTHYTPKETVFEQLKKTKMFETWHKYTDHDVVLVDLGINYKPNFDEIQLYMVTIKAPYQLWFIQEVEPEHPDTILKLTLCEVRGVHERKLDVGGAWHDMYEKGIRGAIRTVQTADIKKAGTITKTKPIKGAPWETML
ncbi:MAG TPA: hypothetical protein VMR08_00395 [Patescibacteria group bacterium]|nr:hypothetical protein [Patescibacteria group bacterium]